MESDDDDFELLLSDDDFMAGIEEEDEDQKEETVEYHMAEADAEAVASGTDDEAEVLSE